MEKCLTIVGRSKSAKIFTQDIVSIIFDVLKEEQVSIEEVEALGDLSDLDGMGRFITFILIDDDSQKGMKMEELFSKLINEQMGVRLFENIKDAQAYAEEHYNYGEKIEYEYEDDLEEDEDDEEFSNFTAEDIEDFLMFESLFRTGKLATIRGKLHGEQVTVMAQIINGPDQIRVTPYAIMVSTEILENMELPKIDERN